MQNNVSILHEIGTLQNDYIKLQYSGHFTKAEMCKLVIPFRDKYGLTDLQALNIARGKMGLLEMADVLEEK